MTEVFNILSSFNLFSTTFPCGSTGKESACNPGFDPWVGKIPWRRARLPTPVFWPGEFHGLYSPWGHKELDSTELLSFHFLLGGNLWNVVQGKGGTQAEYGRQPC